MPFIVRRSIKYKQHDHTNNINIFTWINIRLRISPQYFVDTLFRFNGSRKVNLFQARLSPKSNAPSVSNNFHHLKPTSYPSRHSWTISELQSSLTPPILWFLFPWRPSGISVQFLSEKASSYQKQPIKAFQPEPWTLNRSNQVTLSSQIRKK